jgi:hypothetical protein
LELNGHQRQAQINPERAAATCRWGSDSSDELDSALVARNRSLRMNRLLIVLALTATLAGCGCEDNDAACKAERATATPTGYVTPGAASVVPAVPQRVSVERVGVVADSLAYGGARGIYVIRDAQTGREFIGVSGVGVAETGVHQSGKTQVRDER